MQTEGRGSARRLPSALQDERVVALGGVQIRRVEPLVNDQRTVDPIGRPDRRPECPVLFQTMRRLHPVEDVLAIGVVGLPVEVDRARDELVANVVGGERMRH